LLERDAPTSGRFRAISSPSRLFFWRARLLGRYKSYARDRAMRWAAGWRRPLCPHINGGCESKSSAALRTKWKATVTKSDPASF